MSKENNQNILFYERVSKDSSSRRMEAEFIWDVKKAKHFRTKAAALKELARVKKYAPEAIIIPYNNK